MSRADFDVVTGPSMAHRSLPRPQRPSRSADTAAEPAAPPPTPSAEPSDNEKKRR
jgi:hypothetical protein